MSIPKYNEKNLDDTNLAKQRVLADMVKNYEGDDKKMKANKSRGIGAGSVLSKLMDLVISSLSLTQECRSYVSHGEHDLMLLSKFTSIFGRLLNNFRSMGMLMKSLYPNFNDIKPSEETSLSNTNKDLRSELRDLKAHLIGARFGGEIDILFNQLASVYDEYYDLAKIAFAQYNYHKPVQHLNSEYITCSPRLIGGTCNYKKRTNRLVAFLVLLDAL